jgi:hypothetical protein
MTAKETAMENTVIAGHLKSLMHLDVDAVHVLVTDQAAAQELLSA